MKKITQLIIERKTREQKFVFIAYVMNVIIVSIFLMLATGISDLTNESLSKNDFEQVTAILASVIFVSIITIIFFQWIISMQFRALFHSRKQFNNNMRLMGLKKSKLLRVYISELLYMQIYAVPLGCLISQIAFYILGQSLDLNRKLISIDKLILAILINLIVICLSVLITFRKLVKRDVIMEIRGTDDSNIYQGLSKRQILNSVLGIIAIGMGIYFKRTSGDAKTVAMANMGYSIGLTLLYDLIIVILHKLIDRIAKKTQNYNLLFSENINFGYFKKVKVSSFIIIYGVTIFLGLQMMYMTIREIGSNVVKENIHYSHIIEYIDEICNGEDQNVDDAFYGLRYKTKTPSGSNIYVSGINSQFINGYENIKISSTIYENLEFMENNSFDRADWNGIIMPDYYLSKGNIGDEITINIEGIDVSFRIIAGYNSNNLGNMTSFVSSDYLKHKLKKENSYNVVYLKDLSKFSEASSDIEYSIYSKEDLELESYAKAVNGTTLIEIVSIFIVIFAILSLVNFFIITSGSNIIDISRFRGAGMSRSSTIKVYMYHATLPTVVAFIFAIPSIYIFEIIGCYLMLPADYYVNGMIYKPIFVLGVFALFIVVSIFTQYITIRKSLATANYIRVLRDVDV